VGRLHHFLHHIIQHNLPVMITLIIVTKMMSWNDLALANYVVGCIDGFLLRKKFLSHQAFQQSVP
jgi:hypothetical protein